MTGTTTTVTAGPAPGQSPTRGARQALRDPVTLAALVFVTLLVVAAVLAPWLAPHDPQQQDLNDTLAGPGAEHWLGTDELGRDVLSRLLHGARTSLLAAVVAVAVALAVGLPAGVLAGYLGGWVDRILDRVSDVILSIPSIIVILTVLAVFGPNITAAMVTLGVLFSPDLVRLARSSTLAVRSALYIDAARVAGLPHARIIVRHVLPNVIGPVIIRSSMMCGLALLVEGGLSFLGLGVRPPTPSWGVMVADAGDVAYTQAWLLVPTGALITLTVVAFNLIGDSLHDAAAGVAIVARPGTRPAVKPAVRPADRGAPDPVGAEAGPALLAVRGLEISFPAGDGWQPVVDDVSFDVRPGEALGVVGESGCGKTVTALAVLGLVPPPGAVTGGSITFDGRELVGLSERDHERIRGSQIGFVSQESMVSLDPVFPVGELIAEPIRHHLGLSRRQAADRALELLELVGMTDPRATAARYPHQLSGGMAQRVAIAMALGAQPRLLIADEPTTALDVTTQAEVLDLFRKLQDELSMAVILVTHDLGVLADLCTRAVVMYAGEVVETGPVGELLSRPLMPYTDGLLRSDPHLATPSGRLPTISGTVPAPADWPAGCHFHARCPLATDRCRTEPIPLVEPAPGRASRCVRIEALAGERTP
ncbi:MAG TPA: dipeptide/oligopeptide/nickel ABC transporter permease/ATP-binding protein [Acidimicrobiales bacterium]